MKKTLFYMLLLAGAVACQMAEESQAPVKEEVPASVFHATLEGAEAETKVYTDEALHVLWNADDRVTIFAKTTRNKQYRFLGADGAAGGDFEEVAGGFGTGADIDYNFAVYPYNATTAYSYGDNASDPSDDYLATVFPKAQTYRAGSFGPGANLMVTKSSTTDLPFKNVGGYLCLKLYGSGFSVRSIVLQGNNNETLSGPVKVSIGDGNIPSMEFDTADPSKLEKEIVLSADTPVALGADAANAVTFWMVVPPATLSGGFTVTVIDGNGGMHQKSTSKSITFERNKQTPMKAFEITAGDVLPPLTVNEMGSVPLAGTGFSYNKATDQVNLYEQDNKVWARFLRVPTLTMFEIGPIPADVAMGSNFVADVDVYVDGVKNESESVTDCRLTVQSITGGIINLVSDDGTRYAIRF